MPPYCTPFSIPEEWGQFDVDGDGVFLSIFVNAGNSVEPDWREGVFDLELFTESKGCKKAVEYHDAPSHLASATLPQWVKSQNPNLRGNQRGVLYYDKSDGWSRLADLLPLLIEVRFITMCLNLVMIWCA